MSTMRSLLLLIIFRLLSVYLIRSWFVPDEVFQSVEVAHRVVFSTGHLSWEWDAALRSVFHPTLISSFYWILYKLGWDSQSVVAFVPRILHAVLFGVSDVYFIRLAKRLVPTHSAAFYSCLMYFSSWFVFYCSPRTLANSVETALTIIALNWYPFEANYRRSTWPYMALGVLTILMRPTAGLIWLVLGIAHIVKCKEPIRLILYTCIPSMLPVLIFGVVADSLAFGQPTFSLWNFLKFNVLTGGSALFGVHPFYWYFTEGLPSVLTLQLIPIILGCISPLRPHFLLLLTSVVYIVFHSLLPHKEQRFLLPVIPLLCLYSGSFFNVHNYRTPRKIFAVVIVLFNIVVALYTGLRHQVGPYSAANFIIRDSSVNNPARVMALMPCYSLPGHSYFHNHLQSLRSLDCSPDLDGSGEPEEADVFHNNPHIWLGIHRRELREMTHLVLYEKMYKEIELTLFEYGFKMCARLFHADFLTSSRQDHFIVVACPINT